MPFVNTEVALEELPRFDAVELEPLDDGYARIRVAIAIVMVTPVLVALTVLFVAAPPARAFFVQPLGLLMLFGIGVLLTLVAWLPYKSAKVMGYAIREHDVIVRKGIFWRKETVQPIRRIQHVEVTQGPLDKRFGLANLRLFSAGTGQLAFEIPGLPAEVAARIKQFILEFRNSATAELNPETAEKNPRTAERNPGMAELAVQHGEPIGRRPAPISNHDR